MPDPQSLQVMSLVKANSLMTQPSLGVQGGRVRKSGAVGRRRKGGEVQSVKKFPSATFQANIFMGKMRSCGAPKKSSV